MFNFIEKNNMNLNNNLQHKFALNYSMTLYKRNAIYTMIPKNACSTMRLSIGIDNGFINKRKDINWIHENNHAFSPTNREVVTAEYSFVILRCPFKRLASVFLDKFVSKEPEAWQYRNLRDRTIDLDDLTFRDFVKSLKENNMLRKNPHWKPQVDFLLFKEYTDYFSVERFEDVKHGLKSRIGLNVIDARELTNHGTSSLNLLNDKTFSDTSAFDISIMKRQGCIPSHASLYTEEIYNLVGDLYSDDIKLYMSKFGSENLMSVEEIFKCQFNFDTIVSQDVKTERQVDYIRDSALSVENKNLELAIKLMSIAHEKRPQGIFIADKLRQYHLTSK